MMIFYLRDVLCSSPYENLAYQKKKGCNIKIFQWDFLYILSFTINAFNFVSQIADILENHVLAITSSPFFMV